ncbi:MAG: methyltransferase, partial [Lachnospiraceae bacterium]|nr:methyltransferase [Lachnospiraceae bacterium]
TAAMLSVAEFSPGDKILDLGCGCGPVGILAARLTSPEQVTMSDISAEAVSLAAQNADANGVGQGIRILQSDGFSEISDTDYTKILSNPPYHTDFSVAKGFIEQGFRHLTVGGVLYMVTKRREWYKNKLISVFGGVHIDEIDGYYVFTARKTVAPAVSRAGNTREKTKKAAVKTQQLSKKLARKKQRQKKNHYSNCEAYRR